MSKRVATTPPAIRPIKLLKGGNVWSVIPDDDEKSKEFKPVEGGPKTKLQKTFVLNYNPRVDVSISLNGWNPEVRFSGTDSCFYMTGDEFLDLSASGEGTNQDLDMVRLEPTQEDGFRLARYRQTPSGMPDLFPLAVLEINKYAAKRLKAKLEPICEHVSALRDSEPVIKLMFECVADVYREEYRISNSLIPVTEQFTELARLVETYVPAVVIVKAFLDKMHDNRLLSHFNHYHLCAVASAQKHVILDMIK